MLNTLLANQQLVQAFWDAVNSSAGNLETIAPLVRKLLTTGAWKRREVPQLGRVVEFDRFVDFITMKPLAGCGWPRDKVEALIKDDSDLLRQWQEAMVGANGVHHATDNVSSIKPSHGNSRADTLRRLHKDYPELYARVIAGELSPHAAAIEAGFRKKLSPFEQVLKLWPKLTASQRAQVREMP